jgi:hypothetical protein
MQTKWARCIDIDTCMNIYSPARVARFSNF